MKRTRLRYIISKLNYDSFPQMLLDMLKIVKIRIRLFHVLREGINNKIVDFDTALLDDYEVAVAKREDMHQLVDFPDQQTTLEAWQLRYDRGDLCMAAWWKGKIVAFSWAQLEQFTGWTYRFPLLECEAYLCDAYTSSEHRGRGLAGQLRYRFYLALAQQGRHNLFSISERFNPRALRFKAKLGARIVDSGFSVELFGKWRFGTRPRPEKLRVSMAQFSARQSVVKAQN